MKTGNLFEPLSVALPTEVVEVLARGQGELKIERIVSRGHASPPDFWYDSETTEWVVLLQGCAVLQFAKQIFIGRASLVPLAICGQGRWITVSLES